MNNIVLAKFLNTSIKDIEIIGSKGSNSTNSSGLVIREKSKDLCYFVKAINRFQLLNSIKTSKERNNFLRLLHESNTSSLVTPLCDAETNFILTANEVDYLLFPYATGKLPSHRHEFPPKLIIDAILLMIDHIKIKPDPLNNSLSDRYAFGEIDLTFTKNNSSIKRYQIFDFEEHKEIISRLINEKVKSTHLSTLCHGDLNLSNIIMTPSGVKFIDLDCMIFSTPFLDLLFYLVINGESADSFEYAFQEMANRNYFICTHDYSIFFIYLFGWIGHVFQSLNKDNEIDSIFIQDLTHSLSVGLKIFFNMAKKEFHS